MVILFTISSPSFNSPAPTASAAVAAEVARFTSCPFSYRNCSFLSASCSRSVVLSVSKCFGGMAEIGKKRYSTTAAALAAASAAAENGSGCSFNFLDFRTEEDLLSGIKKAAQTGRLSLNMAQAMEELYHSYRDAVCKSGHPEAHDVALSNTAVALDRIYMDVKDPYEFSPYHKAIREPFDYYLFGQKYIRPLIDFKHSYVGNISLFHEIEEKLKKGENIVFMSNHQSEADPAVIALLLESTNHHLSENMTYVAGDRVITDPLCKPFSMGRNLICVYSKKHINDDPELIEMKKRANTRSLKEMAMLLRSGSQLIWIAPSGGRDRPDPVTQEWYPAQFDAAAVDNMRRLVEYAGVPGHIYPLALLCYDIMPPPPKVEKDIGEKRLISFNGVGLSVGRKIKFHEVTSSFEDAEEAKMAYTKAVYDSVSYQYNVLKSAIYEKRGIGASTPTVSLSQPFQLAN